jgi:hypothetical protein
MMLQLRDSTWQTEQLPIVGGYNLQRFRQYSPEDAANWYELKDEDSKRPIAMYPTMGRRHVTNAGANQLIFGSTPRQEFKTINYWYAVDGNSIYRIDVNYNKVEITGGQVVTISGPMYFSYLVINSIVFACFTDQQKIYIYQENTGIFYTVTDPNAPGQLIINGVVTKPGYIVTFGNRIAVSVLGSSMFCLSEINLLTANVAAGQSAQFQPGYAFTVGTTLNYIPPAPIGAPQVTGSAVFAQEEGIVRQMGVLNNTLYIFTDFTTGVWSNIPAVFSGTGAYFPWKKNSTYNWNYGIADPDSLDIDFGIIAFLAQNSNGLLQFMYSAGDQPKRFSTKAIDVLLQNYTNQFGANNPLTGTSVNGFLYQYENTIFYRISGGPYVDYQILDQEMNAQSIEYSFETQSWHRCIEINGNRCRIQRHIYFNSQHLVTVLNDNTIYEMSGQFYTNEDRNTAQADAQASDAYLAQPFRYERSTAIISNDDYAQLETDFVEIDMVFGDSFLHFSLAPFSNTKFLIGEKADSSGNPVYLIAEQPNADGDPVYLIAEQGNTPSPTDTTYNQLLNPNITLWFSDDGGKSYSSADNLEMAQSGVYQWRMRWYQLGTHRNRSYRLICVSPVPIVILGGTMMIRRSSGGAN